MGKRRSLGGNDRGIVEVQLSDGGLSFYTQVWLPKEERSIWVNIGTNLGEARKHKIEIKHDKHGWLARQNRKRVTNDGNLTFGDMTAAYIKDLERRATVRGPDGVKPSSLKAVLARAASLVEFLGTSRVEAIDNGLIEDYKAHRRAATYNTGKFKGKSRRPIGENTLNQQIILLMTIYRWAKNQTPPLIDRLPEIKKISKKGGFKRPVEILEPHEEAALLKVLEDDYATHLAVRFYLATGMREREAIGVTWANIKPEGIELLETKTDAPRTIGINRTIRALIEECRKLSEGKGHLLRDSNGEPYAKSNNAVLALEYRVRQALKRAGIYKVRGSLFNLFRHTTGSRLVQAGMSYGQAAYVLGNSEAVCKQHYVRFDPKAGANIMAVLDKPVAAAGESAAFMDQTIDRPDSLTGESTIN